MPKVMKQFMRNNTFMTKECKLALPSDYKTRRYTEKPFKPNPYTTLEYEIKWKYEEYPEESIWTGRESRPSWADLRLTAIKRDDYICQMCGKTITIDTAQVDHIKGYKYFKLPVNANRMENLQTLCKSCHNAKTKAKANQ